MVSFITPVVARNRANECVDSFVIAAYSPFIKADDIFGAVSCILLVSSQKMAIDCNLYLRCEQKF